MEEFGRLCQRRSVMRQLLGCICRVCRRFSFVPVQHFRAIKSCKLEFRTHGYRLRRTYLSALSTEHTAIQIILNLSSFSFSHQFHSSGRTSELAQTAPYALFHVPHWATSESWRDTGFLKRILQRCRFPKQLPKSFFKKTQNLTFQPRIV